MRQTFVRRCHGGLGSSRACRVLAIQNMTAGQSAFGAVKFSGAVASFRIFCPPVVSWFPTELRSKNIPRGTSEWWSPLFWMPCDSLRARCTICWMARAERKGHRHAATRAGGPAPRLPFYRPDCRPSVRAGPSSGLTTALSAPQLEMSLSSSLKLRCWNHPPSFHQTSTAQFGQTESFGQYVKKR